MAEAETLNLTMEMNNDYSFLVNNYSDSLETPLDITGYTFYFTVKIDKLDENSEAIIDKTITSHIDPINGITRVSISSSEIEGLYGVYNYDLIRVSDTETKTTLFKGTFTIIQATRKA